MQPLSKLLKIKANHIWKLWLETEDEEKAERFYQAWAAIVGRADYE